VTELENKLVTKLMEIYLEFRLGTLLDLKL
jgi:hypothetical protein